MISIREFCTRVHIGIYIGRRAFNAAGARASGFKISADMSPYCHFAARILVAGSTEFKCIPPLASGSNEKLLWRGLIEGHWNDRFQIIHRSRGMNPAESGDFYAAWGAFHLSVRLPIVWRQQHGAEVCRYGT